MTWDAEANPKGIHSRNSHLNCFKGVIFLPWGLGKNAFIIIIIIIHFQRSQKNTKCKGKIPNVSWQSKSNPPQCQMQQRWWWLISQSSLNKALPCQWWHVSVWASIASTQGEKKCSKNLTNLINWKSTLKEVSKIFQKDFMYLVFQRVISVLHRCWSYFILVSV